MYPEVEQYVAALEVAGEAARRQLVALDAALDAAAKSAGAGTHTSGVLNANCPRCTWLRGPLGVLLGNRGDTVRSELSAAQDAAWATLRASEVPLVRWIAENCEEFPDEALEVLRVLPASLMELDVLAREAGWCGIWDRFRARAIEAGVAPIATKDEVSS